MTKCCVLNCNLIKQIYYKVIRIFKSIGLPILIFAMRFWMARIFWYSGQTKISSWQTTIALFRHEYQVPFISPELAAYMSTSAELICPVLLVFGFMTRLATIPMIIMTLVIQFTYLDLREHFYWLMLLSTILFYGPGKFSIDYFMVHKCQGEKGVCCSCCCSNK
jgi:putative oxidoreductase